MNSISKDEISAGRSASSKIVSRNPRGYGLPAKSMEAAAAGLERVMAGSLRSSPKGHGPVLAWPLACGQEVAKRTQALSFEQNILRVEVPDASWRSELRSLAPQYLAVINRYVAESVRRIEFEIVGDKKPAEAEFKQTVFRKNATNNRT
ncbi:MAG: DUF721 domain-containing protein [Acidobacteriota bacterium]|jgi:hypothetical protein|nr:DUF721 domain-containing protein [Acidobacteriota bacterium]